jgi:hypothetical protein
VADVTEIFLGKLLLQQNDAGILPSVPARQPLGIAAKKIA